MDNAPVYDGLSGCSIPALNCGGSGTIAQTICERTFGGVCANTRPSEMILIKDKKGDRLCSRGVGSKCYVYETATCESLGGSCYDRCPEGYWHIGYEPRGLTFSQFKELPECGDDEICCIPKELPPEYTSGINPLELACSPRYTLVNDPHTASGGTCYCNYLAINDFHRCEDSQIRDSHPCKSENCAPDFVGGASFCCPKGHCSHYLGEITPGIISGTHSQSSTDDGEIMCFAPDSEISYEGLQLKCDNGVWKSSVGCGETIYNYPLYSRADSDFIEGEGSYKYGFKNTPISFDLNLDKKIATDVAVSVSPPDAQVKIIFEDVDGNNIEIDVDGSPTEFIPGDRVALLSKAVGAHRVKFIGSEEGKIYNLSVFCHTSEGHNCNPGEAMCGPGNFCSENLEHLKTETKNRAENICEVFNNRYVELRGLGIDSRTYRNRIQYYYWYGIGGSTTKPDGTVEYRYIMNFLLSAGEYARPDLYSPSCFYCCPKDYCAYRPEAGPNPSKEEAQCLEQGAHRDTDGCKWICSEGRWGKGGEQAMKCGKDCDCNMPGDNLYHCAESFFEGKPKYCCPLGECALENECVLDGTKMWFSSKLYTCRNGEWSGEGYITQSNYKRQVLTNSNQKLTVSLEAGIRDLPNAEEGALQAYHFFDIGGQSGNIELQISHIGNEAWNYEGPAKGEIEIGNTQEIFIELPFTYTATIQVTDFGTAKYLIYSGSTLAVRPTKAK